MALSQVSSSLSPLIGEVIERRQAKTPAFHGTPASRFSRTACSFARGSPLLIQRTSCQTRPAYKGALVSIRCEQSTKEGNGLDVWLGRVAMIGFAVGITVEIATGKGILENFGLVTPLPTVALAVTALVGVLTAIFIFQSASDN